MILDLISGVTLLGSNPLLALGDVAVLAASIALYRKPSRVTPWVLFAVACVRVVGVSAALFLAGGSMASLLTGLLLVYLAMAQYSFQAGTAKSDAARAGTVENKLEGAKQAL
jgi:fatty acid desaturase